MIITKGELVTDSMTFAEAQRDMRQGYLSGALGMLTSAAIWLAAGLVALYMTPGRAMWTLFIGAAFIHPVSVLLAKLLGRSGTHAKGNPLGNLAFASTVWLILSCVLAYGVALYRMELFFPAMLFVIGGRYLSFATLFGMKIYWICGLALAAAGYALVQLHAPAAAAAFTGSALETGFAIAILIRVREQRGDQAPVAS
ncbi:MAG TPA: hypothetical protein VGM16_00300 [Gammaproteobacteria bacterium]|jgi:hypothetical protein